MQEKRQVVMEPWVYLINWVICPVGRCLRPNRSEHSQRQDLQSAPYYYTEQNLSPIMAANEGQREIVQNGTWTSQEVRGGEGVACILGGPGGT